jgi:hypothetical protein
MRTCGEEDLDADDVLERPAEGLARGVVREALVPVIRKEGEDGEDLGSKHDAEEGGEQRLGEVGLFDDLCARSG